MKEFLITGILCCLMFLSGFLAAPPARGEDQVPQARPCSVSAIVRWNIDEKEKVREGSLNLTANGTLKLSEQLRKPVSKMQGNINYEVEHLDLRYSYQDRITEKESSICPGNTIIEEWSGSGSYRFGGGDPSGAGLYIRNVGTMSPPASMVKGAGAEEFLAMLQAQAPEVATNYYEFFGFGTPPAGVKKGIVANGKIRENDCSFRDSKRNLFPAMSLRFKIPEDGKLQGERGWKAEYTGGMAMFKIGVSDLPETMEMEPFKPAKSASGDISYRVSWSFEEVKPEVRIYRIAEGDEEKNRDITEMEDETIIGEKITLTAKALGLLDSEINEPVWKINGKFIEDFKAGPDQGELDNEVDLRSDEVTFAWTRGSFAGESTQVEVSGMVGGKQVAGKTTFKVFSPKIAGRNVRCSPNVTLGERYELDNIVPRESLENVSCRELDADPEKYFDNLNKHCSVYPGQVQSLCDPKKLERAFTAEHTVQLPWIPKQGYSVQYVQLIVEDSTITNFDGTAKHKENSGWCIDTKYPYKRLTYPSISGEGGGGQPMVSGENTDSCPGPWCRISMEDTPELPLEQGSVKVLLDASLTHSFETYLMFRPSNRDSDKESLWVPLAKVAWGWSVEAKRLVDWKENLPCAASYEISNPSPPADSGCSQSANPDYPEWDCNVVKNDQ